MGLLGSYFSKRRAIAIGVATTGNSVGVSHLSHVKARQHHPLVVSVHEEFSLQVIGRSDTSILQESKPNAQYMHRLTHTLTLASTS